jgi:hypothetical protein
MFLISPTAIASLVEDGEGRTGGPARILIFPSYIVQEAHVQVVVVDVVSSTILSLNPARKILISDI